MSFFVESVVRRLQTSLPSEREAPVPLAVQPIIVGMPDVRSIRARTGLSQAAFARSIGVKPATLRNWEQKRREPDGPARVLLALIARDPGIVQRLLAA
ncbi:MAG: helix-turn-helix domain-containing protein [Tabrizicola sp.]|nr:helix-turn-helix domain-containing protein [Tabrizicola sp.]